MGNESPITRPAPAKAPPTADSGLSAVYQSEDPEDGKIVIQEGPTGFAGGQIQGQRGEQQDCYGWTVLADGRGQQLQLIIADGMGGHAGGAVASRMAVDAFGSHFDRAEPAVSHRLNDSLERANRELAAAKRKDFALDDMGTTLIGAHITGERRLRWISVGDSPLWRLSCGRLERLNKDHSMKPVLAQLVEFGDLTPEEAATDSRRNMLRSAVMGDEISLRDLQDYAVELAYGDVLILATDGLETLDEATITRIVDANRQSVGGTVEALLVAVRDRDRPRQDNATVIVYIPGHGAEEVPTQRVANPSGSR